MLLDNKGRLFGKINIIDLLILLIIIGAVVGAAYKFRTASVGQAETIVLKFYAEEVSEFVTDAVHVGDDVVDDTKSTYLGKIVDCKVDDSVVWGMNDKGEYVKTTKPGVNSILITTEVTGTIGNNGTIINISSLHLSIGKRMSSNRTLL